MPRRNVNAGRRNKGSDGLSEERLQFLKEASTPYSLQRMGRTARVLLHLEYDGEGNVARSSRTLPQLNSQEITPSVD